jgi:hypothetical protein
MTERNDRERQVAQVDDLVERIGIPREEAERVAEDADLWRVPAESRYAFLDPEEDSRQWQRAYDFADGLHEGLGDSRAFNEATQQLLHEMVVVAREALRRARRRSQGFPKGYTPRPGLDERTSAWVEVLKDAVVQLDTAAADREEEGAEAIGTRIREVIEALEDGSRARRSRVPSAGNLKNLRNLRSPRRSLAKLRRLSRPQKSPRPSPTSTMA